MRYYLERLFSSYANVPEDDDDDNKPENCPTLVVRPTVRQAPDVNSWLVGRRQNEELSEFFARRTAESTWQSAQSFFEQWHERVCSAVGPANVAPYWRRVMDFARAVEEEELTDPNLTRD